MPSLAVSGRELREGPEEAVEVRRREAAVEEAAEVAQAARAAEGAANARWWEVADRRREAAKARIASRVCDMKDKACEHGYQGGEGGEQRWESTALQGTGGDRDIYVGSPRRTDA